MVCLWGVRLQAMAEGNDPVVLGGGADWEPPWKLPTHSKNVPIPTGFPRAATSFREHGAKLKLYNRRTCGHGVKVDPLKSGNSRTHYICSGTGQAPDPGVT